MLEKGIEMLICICLIIEDFGWINWNMFFSIDTRLTQKDLDGDYWDCLNFLFSRHNPFGKTILFRIFHILIFLHKIRFQLKREKYQKYFYKYFVS